MADIDVEIDEPTNSVVHERSGREYSTRILRWFELHESLTSDLASWKFDWFVEATNPKKFVCALMVEDHDVVQGLISIVPAEGFLLVSLVESAPHNVGGNKIFRGVAANLFAFACLRSISLGFEGEVAFDAKTELIEHYRISLGAVRVGRSSRMLVQSPAAIQLVSRYHKEKDQWPL